MVLDDPWAQSHGGTQRTRALLGAARDLGHDVVCVYTSGATADDPDEREGILKIPVAASPIGEHDAVPAIIGRAKRHLLPLPTVRGASSRRLVDAIRSVGFADVFVVQQLRTAQYFEVLPTSRLWFDQVDLWSEFARSEARVRRAPGRWTSRMQGLAFERLEGAYARKAAVATAAGYSDRARLETVSGRQVQWLPNPVAGVALPARSSQEPKTAGLLGNFAYWPNRAAYEVLRGTWAPRLRALGWNVVVAGHGSSELPADPGVVRLGALGSPAEFYERVDVALAPILTGGGIKVKVLEAFMAGIPVVATRAALEGFPPIRPESVLEVDEGGRGLDDLDTFRERWVPVSPDLLRRFSFGAFTECVEQCLSIATSR